MTLTQINQTIAELDQVRQKINAFVIAALPTMGPDCLKLVLAITAMVAQGGANPAQVMEALADLAQINKDITSAELAVKAQPATAA
jgi:hypothetical protein